MSEQHYYDYTNKWRRPYFVNIFSFHSPKSADRNIFLCKTPFCEVSNIYTILPSSTFSFKVEIARNSPF